MKPFLRSTPVLLALLISAQGEAQIDTLGVEQVDTVTVPEDNIRLDGSVWELLDAQQRGPVKRGKVVVTDVQDRSFIKTTYILADGSYAIELPYDRSYRVMFVGRDLVSRHVLIDARNIPPEDKIGGYGVHMDMTLIRRRPRLDYSLCNRPAGSARYDPQTTTIVWDMVAYEQTHAEWTAFLETYFDAKKRDR